MSKKFTKDELNAQKDTALNELDKLLADLIASSDVHLQKKASLLSYWMQKYTQYIREEDSFDPTKLKSYKRGDIVKLNFGFNVSSEYGGLHYAIVVNKANARNSPVLTVIPLTSPKVGDSVHPNDLFLGNEIYRSLKIKYDTISQNLQREREEIKKFQQIFDSHIKLIDEKFDKYDENPTQNANDLLEIKKHLDDAKKLQAEWEKKEKYNAEASAQLEKIGAEIKRMKTGSIAVVDQITTVSKMRIYDPRNAHGVLSGVRLSPDSLDKVNNKLKELFIF